MPSTDTATYWLMPGETPLGPYRTEEILAQIQACSCTWTTKASLVGSQTWVPLNQLLTLAPVAALATGSESAASPPPVTPTVTPSTRGSIFSSPATKYFLLALLVLVLYLMVRDGGGWMRSSMTPQQACQALFSSKNATEARKYVTPNLNAALDMLAAQGEFEQDNSEKLELSSEQAAPLQAGGGYYVAYRIHYREAGVLTTFDGVFHVVDHSGYKVNDWFIFSHNGQAIEPPLSLAREYEFFRDPQNPAVATRQMTEAKKQAQQWHAKNNNQLIRVAGHALVNGGLGKWLLVVIGGIGVAVVGFFKNQTSATPSKPS